MPQTDMPNGFHLTVMQQIDGEGGGDTAPRYFASGPYEYFSVSLKEGDAFHHADLDGYVLFCLSASGNGVIQIEGADAPLSVGGSSLVENSLSLKAVGGRMNVLIAGAKRPKKRSDSVSLTKGGQHYAVNKPWGHELWINGEDPDFCFKEVFISAGNRTSLQYHNLKSETNLLVQGTADVDFQARPDVPIDDVTSEHLGTYRAIPVTIIDIAPHTLHRITAVTDVLLYEVSTPHLDDVIRIQDDSNRQHGRVKTEHANS